MTDEAPSSRRIALVLEYDGMQFNGWQRQKSGRSVQEDLEQALRAVDGGDCRTVAAGRTDAGVHAEALLVHADVDAGRWRRSPRAYMHGVNQHLPPSLRVVGVRGVHGGFHARFDCLERAYRYRIWNRPTASALHAWRHWWMPRALSTDAMNAAAAFLVGEHDFSAFRAAGCQSHSASRDLRQLRVERDGWVVSIDVRANAFLYHMVRNIVGSLVRVGVGDWQSSDIRNLLESRDRGLGAATAPAHGLYFRDAVYEGFRASELVGDVSG
ncbi:MAG TPA: tRNA pseudouridine(38-40) synthase TruA [Mariprofundaceae bacterium]|nr:tRNA pseudouridine(38-40) synthase TruA [Mariprofundaceae bacterium]